MPEALERPVPWVSRAVREATPAERQSLPRLRAELLEALTPEVASSYGTPEARLRFAVVRLGLSPSAPNTRLTETHDFERMVEGAFEEAQQQSLAAA